MMRTPFHTRTICIGILLMFFGLTGVAQEEHTVYLNLNTGTHGSGDLSGYSFDVLYAKRINKRFSWFAEIGASLHDKQDKMLVMVNDEEHDASIRYTNGGMQLSGGMLYNILRVSGNELHIGLAPLFRYQTSSLPNVVDTYYPILTNLPYPVYWFIHEEPMRIFSLGGRLQLRYMYAINERLLLGANGNFQADTNGDNIYAYGVSAGVRF